MTQDHLSLVRALETLDSLRPLFPTRQPHLAVEINLADPRAFTLGNGFVRIGRAWVDSDPLQTQRALIMGVLKRENPQTYSNQFQLEVMTDFLLMTVFGRDEWYEHSVGEDIKFSTTAPSFSDYCHSPFRSLAHDEACRLPDPDSVDLQASVWGFRPLLASALWRVYRQASLGQKLKVLRAIRQGRPLPALAKLEDSSLEGLVHWFELSLNSYASAMRFPTLDDSVKRAMKELEVESPTHWELTVDVTNTPAWKEILQQLQKWSQFHKGERTLVFTPEGAVALPSNLPVAWAGENIHSQKHVMIACAWPEAENMVPVSARHVFAKQSCGKIESIFWN